MHSSLITYIGQAITCTFATVAVVDSLTGNAIIPALTASGFALALLAIAVGNMDRNSIFYPSVYGSACWLVILRVAA
jgi:hypothetical protein